MPCLLPGHEVGIHLLQPSSISRSCFGLMRNGSFLSISLGGEIDGHKAPPKSTRDMRPLLIEARYFADVRLSLEVPPVL